VPIHFTSLFTFINLPPASSPIIFLSQPLTIALLLFFCHGFFFCLLHHFFWIWIFLRTYSRIRSNSCLWSSCPLHWDAEEWDFHSQSEDDESLTDGEDLALLFGAELEEDKDDTTWEEDFSPSEERVDSFSSEEDPMAGNFLFGRSSDEASDDTGEVEDDDGFTSNSSGNDDSGDNSSDDSGVSVAPPTKRRKTTGVYWW
jgi:hypothetical protein